MKIVLPEDFFSILKNHHLLLDTSVFIDAFISPFDKTKKLVVLYKAEGKAVSITDMILGGALMQYKNSLSYGVYSYT